MNEDPFPFLIPLNNQFNEFKGFIHVLGKQYPIEIKLYNSNNNNNNTTNENTLYIEDLEINCTKELYDILLPSLQTLKNRFIHCKNLQQFFFEFKDIIDRLLPSTSTSNTTTTKQLPFDTFSLLLKEIDECGWNRVVNIDVTLSTFEILLRDINEREFIVEFQVSENYPKTFPTIKVELPIDYNQLILNLRSAIDKDSTINNKENENDDSYNIYSISNLVSKIQPMINTEFQYFFNTMDEIDANCWVLEPINAKRSSRYRRIAIGDGCSISFEVNPYSPRNQPTNVIIFGPSPVAIPLQRLYTSNKANWDIDIPVIDNIIAILDITLPLKHNTSIEEIIIECSICYSHSLTVQDDHNVESTVIPSENCPNIKCSKQFHHYCISNWLNSLSTTNLNSNQLSGECPFCKTKIVIDKIR